MSDWLGSYRVIEKLSPVHFELRTIINKKVVFSCQALIQIWHQLTLRLLMTLWSRTLMNLIFQKIVLNQFLLKRVLKTLTYIQLLLKCHCPYSLKRERIKRRIRPQSTSKCKKESTTEAIAIDNETVFSAGKILKYRKRIGRVEYLSNWSSGSPILRTNHRGNRNTILWIDVSLINIFNHKINYSFCTLPCCLAYTVFLWFSVSHELSSVIPKIFLSMNLWTPSLRFFSVSIIFL